MILGTGTGTVSLGSSSQTFTVDGSSTADLIISAAIAGSGAGISKTGYGTLN